MTDVRPWFERWPELEAWELARFDARELPSEVDAERRAAGQLVVRTHLSYQGAVVDIRVAYPSEYPELPPVVYGPPGLLDRHQHLFGGNFCLLERPLDDWKAQKWGAADLIAQQLLRLLRDSESGPETVRHAEAPMPEPITAYFQYAADAAVLVPGELVSPFGEGGTLHVRRLTPHLFVIQNADGITGAEELQQVFPGGQALRAAWLRIPAAPDGGQGNGASVAAWLRHHHPSLLARPLPPALARKSQRLQGPPAIELVGLTFPEEGPGVDETRDAWIFLLVDRTSGTPQEHLLHAQIVSPAERARRVPELDGLADARVIVCGLGSLGGDIAIELAKAGVGHLDLIDFDRFEAANTVRHPLGIDFAGLPKSRAVALGCRRANPFGEALEHELRFGEDHWTLDASPLERVATLLQDADLMVEATGSHQVAQFVARMASDADVPLVAGWMTDGAWGAELVRIRPGTTLCWTCFATAHGQGRLPAADRGPRSSVVVQGCSHPTTIGSGFDAAETAALLTRLAVGTLQPRGGYPDAPWDYAAVSFRRLPDDPKHPRMATTTLSPNESCPQCLAAVGSTARR